MLKNINLYLSIPWFILGFVGIAMGEKGYPSAYIGIGALFFDSWLKRDRLK